MSTDSHSSRASSELDGAAAIGGAPDVGFSPAAKPEISTGDDAPHRLDNRSTDGDGGSSERSSGNDSGRGRSSGRRLKRPSMPSRKSSGTIIVPRDRSTNSDTEPVDYPPDDARAMSPRRNSEETEAMNQEMRATLKSSARETQLTLLEIAESIELVRQSHSQLQRQNEMLQDYIGGLTRSMSQPQARGGKGGKK